MSHYKELLKIATLAAKAGGEQLLAYQGKLKNIRDKSRPGDLVTEADLASEEAVLEIIQKEVPDHGILAEESGLHESKSDYLWAIDPLDGTVNYAHQFPFYCVSIGVLYKKQPIVGVILAPYYNELFQGAKGEGATLNGVPVQVSSCKTLDKSLLITGFAYNRNDTEDNNYKEFVHLSGLSHGIRRPGAAALDLAYLASGRAEGFWERFLNPWDVAAGAIILQEAGGQVSAYDNSPLDVFAEEILATNGLIHKALSEEIMGVRTR